MDRCEFCDKEKIGESMKKLTNPYPEDIFTEPTKYEMNQLKIFCIDNKINQDKFFGSFGIKKNKKKLMNFTKFYEEEGKRIRTDETNKDVPVRFKHLILPLLPKKIKTIIDVGSGDGYAVNKLREKNFSAHGIELSKERIKFAIKKYGNYYRQGNIYSTVFPENEFDVVIASEVIEHLDNPLKAIEELKRISKKYILLTFPYKEIPQQIVCPYCLKNFPSSGHIQYFDDERIKEIILKSNLKIIKTRKLTYFPFHIFPEFIAVVSNFTLGILKKNTYIGILCKK